MLHIFQICFDELQIGVWSSHFFSECVFELTGTCLVFNYTAQLYYHLCDFAPRPSRNTIYFPCVRYMVEWQYSLTRVTEQTAKATEHEGDESNSQCLLTFVKTSSQVWQQVRLIFDHYKCFWLSAWDKQRTMKKMRWLVRYPLVHFRGHAKYQPFACWLAIKQVQLYCNKGEFRGRGYVQEICHN